LHLSSPVPRVKYQKTSDSTSWCVFNSVGVEIPTKSTYIYIFVGDVASRLGWIFPFWGADLKSVFKQANQSSKIFGKINPSLTHFSDLGIISLFI